MSTARVMLAGSGLPTTQHIAMSIHIEPSTVYEYTPDILKMEQQHHLACVMTLSNKLPMSQLGTTGPWIHTLR